jgi:hypothetical protein
MAENFFPDIKESNRIRAFDSGILSGLFGPKSNEMIGGRRKWYNEELHNLYSFPNIVKPGRTRDMHDREEQIRIFQGFL